MHTPGIVVMVWQRILNKFAAKKRTQQHNHRKRRLLLESLTKRELLAANIGEISGTAFTDNNGNGQFDVGEPILPNVGVALFRDDGVGNAGTLVTSGPNADTQVGLTTSDATTGEYRFSSLSADDYFVQQATSGGLLPPAATLVTVTADQADGQTIVSIDTFTSGAQLVVQSGGGMGATFVSAPDALGGERDVQLTHTNGSGNTTFQVDTGTELMSLSTGGGATAQAIVEYDGVDNAFGLNVPPGFAPASAFAGGSPGDPLPVDVGLELLVRAENQDEDLLVTIYTSATQASEATITIPQSATLQSVFLEFSNFVESNATGITAPADFNSVIAVRARAQVTLADNDIFFSVVESRGPDPTPQNLANIQPIALGGTLFQDTDTLDNGMFETANEDGLAGVTVELYQGSLAGAPIATDVTVGDGSYRFNDLVPDDYFVRIPSSQFTAGMPAFGFVSSTGVADPNNDVLGDDNGAPDSGGVTTSAIVLESNTEPTSEDGNANTNLTIDFGLVPQIDLTIVKTLNEGLSSIQPGGSAIFDVQVVNNGPAVATGVTVADVIPAGLIFDPGSSDFGAFSPNFASPNLSVPIGTLAPGDPAATFRIGTAIDAAQTSDITNLATVTANEFETNVNDNSDDALVDLTAADLVITKTDNTDPVSAGNQLVYTITVTNQGPDAAVDVTAIDTLPTDVSFVSFNFTTGTGTVTQNPTGVLTIDMGDLASGASSVVDITVDVAPTATSPLNNVATVQANPDNDPDQNNNNTNEPTDVQRVVDVGVTKSVSGTPIAGSTQDRLTYTLIVSNTGPGEARGVMVTDTLDNRISFNSFDPGNSGVTLNPNGQLVFSVGTLAVNESVQFSFDVDIDSAAVGLLPNTAVVTTSDTDNNTANNTSTVNTTIQNRVDLILEKTVAPLTAVPGQDQLVYTFTIDHDTDSPSDAFNVVITDALPAGVTGAVINAPGATSQNFNNTTQTATVSYDTIPVGADRTFTITVDVNEDATGTIINPATVAADNDFDTSNNSDTATTGLTPEFDVTLTKAADNTTPTSGQNVTYTIDVTNAGPSTATGVILSDDIPSGLTFVSGTLNGSNATSNGTTVTFPAITIGDGQTETATLIFAVAAGASGPIVNTASVVADSGETITNNNDATATVTVTPETDLQVTKSVNLTSAQAGSNLVYTITVNNLGSANALNVVATDTLPTGVTFVSGTGPNNEALSVNNGVVTVNGGTLAAGSNFSFTINATVNSGVSTDQTNTVDVTTDTVDPNSNNDRAIVVTSVDPVNASIAGAVYIDANNNGIRDTNEVGIEGVTITLTGTDTLQNTVNREVMTNTDGEYLFANLAAGTYQVQETQPLGLRDGQDTAGTGALTSNTADDVFTELGIAAGGQAQDFNFGERNERLSKRRFLASS